MNGSVFKGALLMACAALCGCSSEKDEPAGASCAAPGGPATGPADTAHCMQSGARFVQETSAEACNAAPHEHAEGEEHEEEDAGAAASEYGEPFFGTQVADDQCKYDVALSTTPVCVNDAVTLRAVLKSRADATPVTGANARIDVFLSETHVAPNAGRSTTEDPPGTYTISPVRFDASGRWTVRWHFFENCGDEPEESPHGHVAFYVDVP
jgi:hypothetical protein